MLLNIYTEQIYLDNSQSSKWSMTKNKDSHVL